MRPVLLIWILIPAIFIADLREPAGYEIPLLYTPVVLLTMWATRIELAVETSAVVTLLTAIDFALGRSGDLSSGTFNRLLAIVVLWLTAGGVTMPEKPLGKTRREHVDALGKHFLKEQAKQWTNIFKTPVPEAFWSKGISCLSVDCISLDNVSGERTGWAGWSPQLAAQGKARYEARQIRVAREKVEHEARLEAKAEAKLADLTAASKLTEPAALDRKRAVIEAALARARARRAPPG